MKTRIVSVVVVGLMVCTVLRGYADPGVSAAYNPTNSMESVSAQKDADMAPDAAANASASADAAAARDATADAKDADMAPDAADKAAATEANKEALDEVKKDETCVNFGAKIAGSDWKKTTTGSCTAVDYTQAAPVAPTGAAPTTTAMGADARDQAAYNPPANPKVNGSTLSWGKIESFDELGAQRGVPANTRAAIAGRLEVESNAFKLNQWDANGNLLTKYGASSEGDYNKATGQYTSFGVAQYHNTKDTNGDGMVDAGRGTNMMNAVGGKSLTPSGLQGTTNAQYNYLYNELDKQVGSSNYNTLMDPNTSVDKAAEIYTAKYEVPAKDASQDFGLAGGTATVNNANAIYQVTNGATVTNNSVSSWENSYTPGKNQNTGGTYVVTAGSSGSGTSGSSGTNGSSGSSGSAATTAGGLLNSIFGTGTTGTTGTTGSASSITNQVITAAIANALSGKSSTTATTGTAATNTATSSSGTHALDIYKAIATKCGRDLPSSADAIMLMVKECQTTTN